METKTVYNVGLVGWGLSATVFHAPFIRHTPGLQLSTVVSRRPPDLAGYPDTKWLNSFDLLLADRAIDIVVITTPNALHVPQTLAALNAGKHVIVEKPVARTAREVEQLIAAAKAANRLLIPFQNRRWDSDFLTVRNVLLSGALGNVERVESQWPKFRPNPHERAAWKADGDVFNGLIYDLGSHMVDQIVQLFGKPDSIFADIQTNRPGSTSHDFFRLQIAFANGPEVLLTVDLLDAEPGPRFLLKGSTGTYVHDALDVQEQQLAQGMLPGDPLLGVDRSGSGGRLHTVDASGRAVVNDIAAQRGDYGAFYAGVVAALNEGSPVPVTPASVVPQIAVIEAAIVSAESGERVRLT